MIILGLDVASIDTGWAVLRFTGDGPPSLLDKGLIHQPSGWKVGKKLFHFRAALQEVVHSAQCNVVVVERPFIFAKTAVESLYRFHGIVSEVVYDIKAQEVVQMAVDKIRSRLGVSVKKKKGQKKLNAKEPVRLLVNRKFGINLTEEEYDISDAIAAAWAGYSEVRKIGKEKAKKETGKKKQKQGKG